MFDFIFIMISQVIKPKAVFLEINKLQELRFQQCALPGIYNTFKHGILYPLSMIDTLFCHFSQPCFSACIFRIYIICNQHKHFVPPFYHKQSLRFQYPFSFSDAQTLLPLWLDRNLCRVGCVDFLQHPSLLFCKLCQTGYSSSFTGIFSILSLLLRCRNII